MKIKIEGSSKALSESDIIQAERRLGRAIPTVYREFLLKYNGGYPESSDFVMINQRANSTQIGTVDWFLGINTDETTLSLQYTLKTFQGRLPTRLFPFARDPGGNLICITTEGENHGQIWFWDHEWEAEEIEAPSEENLCFVANDFDAFLEKLK